MTVECRNSGVSQQWSVATVECRNFMFRIVNVKQRGVMFHKDCWSRRAIISRNDPSFPCQFVNLSAVWRSAVARYDRTWVGLAPHSVSERGVPQEPRISGTTLTLTPRMRPRAEGAVGHLGLFCQNNRLSCKISPYLYGLSPSRRVRVGGFNLWVCSA